MRGHADPFNERHRVLGVLGVLCVLLIVGILTGEVLGHLLARIVELILTTLSTGSA